MDFHVNDDATAMLVQPDIRIKYFDVIFAQMNRATSVSHRKT